MPKAIQYNPNSVIYFEGDIEDKVYILQKGSIVMTFTDIETGSRVNEYIKQGEFFGVKSALGHFPREETIMVLGETTVLMFTSSEFESFAMSNTRIIMKMLKVFSNQLRKIHKQTESKLQSTRDMRPDEGLYSVALAFFNSKKYPQAENIFKRYLKTYPNGSHASEALTLAKKSAAINTSIVNKAENESIQTLEPHTEDKGNENAVFLLAGQLMGRKKYQEAFLEYQKIISSPESKLTADACLGAGECLYYLEDYDEGIKILTKMISMSPRHPKMGEALCYIGLAYGKKGNSEKKQAFITKAMSVADADLMQKINQLQHGEQ